MKIAILDCATLTELGLGQYESVGQLVKNWLTPHLSDTVFDIIAIAYGAEFPDISSYDAFILPGSEHGVYDKPPWIEPLRLYLLELREARKPLLGICFGHQLMAHTFGGHAANADKGMCVSTRCWTMGDETFDARVLHQDQVLEVPPGAQVLGGADYCPNGVISYDFPALSMQFHPEYTRDFVNDVVDILPIEVLSKDEAEVARSSKL